MLLKLCDSVIMSEIVLGILCPTWKGDKPFFSEVTAFLLLTFGQPQFALCLILPKFSLLLEEWINNCNEVSSFSVVFSIPFSSSDIYRNCLYSQRIGGSE